MDPLSYKLAKRALAEIALLDGAQVELQKSATAIQWRKVGDETWTDLVPLEDITGPAGDYLDLVNRPTLDVRAYGAVGDNSTDDTAAIQAAADAANGDVLFFPPGRYKLAGSVTIDPAKVRAVIGHGAYLRATTDVPALIIDGGLTSGTATPPNTNTDSIKATEMMPRIVGLTIYSTEDPYVGTGIRVTQTFGIIIEGVNLYNLSTGIEFTSHNRNVIVHGSHIWDCVDYGVHFNDVNQHQTILANNHISYASRVIYFEEGDVHNVHIVGNDLETGDGQGAVIHFDAQDNGSQHSQVQIVGNSIEGHLGNTEALITFDRGSGIISTVQVTGNEFSGSSEPAIEISGASSIAITGNSFRSLEDYAIFLSGYANFVTVVGNTFSAPESSTRFMGVLQATLTAESGGLKLDSNTATGMMRNPIAISVTSALLYEVSINDNILHMAATRGSGAPDITAGYMLDINSNDDLAGISVRGNQLRSRDYCGHGIRVAGDTYEVVRVLDNDIRGLPAGKTAYTLPSPAADVTLGDPYDLQLGFPGVPDAGAEDIMLLPRPVTIGAGDPGEVYVGVSPTDGTATIDIQVNGVSVGGIDITTGGVVTWDLSADIQLDTGDRLALVAPSPADSTLAGVLVAFKGVTR